MNFSDALLGHKLKIKDLVLCEFDDRNRILFFANLIEKNDRS